MFQALFSIIAIFVSSVGFASCADEVVRYVDVPMSCMNRGTCHLEIDYDHDVTQMIEELEPEWYDKRITPKLYSFDKKTGVVEVDIRLLYFGQSMSTDVMMYEINERGLEPGGIEHLLALGVQYPPHIAWQGPVVSLGSLGLVGDTKLVPCLDVEGDYPNQQRKLVLMQYNRLWQDDTRFIAVIP